LQNSMFFACSGYLTNQLLKVSYFNFSLRAPTWN
jgi:hypothetical protein